MATIPGLTTSRGVSGALTPRAPPASLKSHSHARLPLRCISRSHVDQATKQLHSSSPPSRTSNPVPAQLRTPRVLNPQPRTCGAQSPEVLDDSASPFTERQSTKRHLGGVGGHGHVSIVDVDPLFQDLQHPQNLKPQPYPNTHSISGSLHSPPPQPFHLGHPPEVEMPADLLPAHAPRSATSYASLVHPSTSTRTISSTTSSIHCSTTSTPSNITTTSSSTASSRAGSSSSGSISPGAAPGEDSAEDPDAANDISLRLPELRELLQYLKQAQGREQQSRQEGERGEGGRLGRVYLVGTGPGDAELLTVKAWRLLQRADLVLYDRLVSRDVLDLIHPGARLLYVGKTTSYHSRTQDEIHELLLSFAHAGASVVRLKGGDPLVFGRGGEEVEYLQDRGIQVDIVPGITSASGIAAELGIPLTHRGLANSVRFLTGHSRKGGEDPLHVAESAADPDSTLVIYMGLATLPGIVGKLVENGLPASTPAVAVERGTTPWQRNVFSDLASLPEAVAAAELVSPTLVIVGQVVALSRLWPTKQHSDGVPVDDPYSDRLTETPMVMDHSTAPFSETSPLPAHADEYAGRLSDGRGRGREPRDRRQRGPDPLLPSERAQG